MKINTLSSTLSYLSIKLVTIVTVAPVYDIMQFISGASNNDHDLSVEHRAELKDAFCVRK